ncbi:flavoprotein [Streptomyces sp. SudanB182_2057]|uniref:flavoprotein n=1 Tax=Streptomyces sp. SudanB182_2057 TaxID=3035281 RepID=UPI003F559154
MTTPLPGSPETGGAPALGIERLLLVITGSVSAAHMPFWLNWLGMTYPDLEIKVVVTPSAGRFVTRTALSTGPGGREVCTDTWPGEDTHALHVEWGEWAQAVLVYPASFQFLARLALGLADTPALLAAQCTTAPVVVAPGLPPGGWQSPACVAHVTALKARPNTEVLTPLQGLSRATGRQEAWTPAMLPDTLRAIERLR